jgi:ABC-type polysaccharide/polyol phosphate transport system ATPase subunit
VTAIVAEKVSKRYARYGRKRSIGTLKSALLSGAISRSLAPDRTFLALEDVSFAGASGETVGVIGENGSGKSTLLKLVAGILRPTSGRLETHGRIAALIELGAGFHPEITARENIEINGLLLGMPRREIARRFDSIVEFAGIGDFLDQPIKTFSSGMTVRLGFSIAAHLEPDILLVDEVLAVGDEVFVRRCLEKIGEFQRQGRTLLLVSHDLDRVAAHCPRVLRLEAGRLVDDAPAAESIGRYRDEVARREGRTRFALDRSGERWGSGAAAITMVRTSGPAGESRAFLSGEAFRVEIAGSVREPTSDFVVGIQIARTDGTVVFGSNTAIDGVAMPPVSGAFRVVLEIPRLELSAGSYSLDAAVHAADGSPYDYRRDVLRFDVRSPAATSGCWLPERRWTLG